MEVKTTLGAQIDFIAVAIAKGWEIYCGREKSVASITAFSIGNGKR